AVVEARVRLAGRGFLVHRALARVLYRKRGCDDERLLDHVAPLRLEKHAADSGIDRKLRELAPERSELAARVDRAQLLEQIVSSVYGRLARRVDEGKCIHLAKTRGEHAQDDFREVRPLDLR